MKVSQLFASILALFVLNSAISNHLILQNSSNNKKLSNYVCKVAKDILKTKNDTQDVLIGNLDGITWSSTVNDIAECVGSVSAVVVSDFEQILTEQTLRKAAIVILFSNNVARFLVNLLINKNSISTVWHHMAKFLLIIPGDIKLKDRFNFIQYFVRFGFIDVATVHETAKHDIRFETFITLGGEASMEINDFDAALLFPDKLKNMTGYVYRIIVYRQIPRIHIHREHPKSPLVHFISMIEKIQNAKVQYTILKDEKQLIDYYFDRHMDLTLNTGIKVISPSIKLMTYEEFSYCALVPLPTPTTFGQAIFVEPFDGLTWLCLVLTMACCVLVFSMFRGHGAVDSPWLLAYGIFVMFIGQGVDFSRQNRLVLTILLELIIVMIWVLCNAYEGVVTSFMIQPIHEHRLETFDDLVASDFEVLTDQIFVKVVEAIDAYKLLLPRLNSSGSVLTDELQTEFQRSHFVFIMPCDIANILIDVTFPNDKRTSDFYYMLPQKIFPLLVQLEASYFNPFIERLQYYMDLSFQAGLMHIWEIMSPENRVFISSPVKPEEKSYLELNDLAVVFHILIIGYAISGALFLFEIFFHDILVKLKLANHAQKLRNRVHQLAYKKRKQPKHPKYQKGALYYIIHRHKRVKRLSPKKLRVRRIYVQPRFPMD